MFVDAGDFRADLTEIINRLLRRSSWSDVFRTALGSSINIVAVKLLKIVGSITFERLKLAPLLMILAVGLSLTLW